MIKLESIEELSEKNQQKPLKKFLENWRKTLSPNK